MYRLLSIVMLMFATSYVIAQGVSCPSSQAIQDQNFMGILKVRHAPKYMAFQVDNYNTKQKWGFVLSNIAADNLTDALLKANDSLGHLVYEGGQPERTPDDGYICGYDFDGDYDYLAIAFTPVPPGSALDQDIWQLTSS